MPSKEHEELNIIAAKWLRKNGFGVVATNIGCSLSREVVDAIGFRETCSVLIESKVSRSDFKADMKKPERNGSLKGVGLYRLYICPEGLIKPEELPKGWGLIYVKSKKITQQFFATGNYWLNEDFSEDENWGKWQHERDEAAEKSMLFSIARRSLNKKPLYN
tara:strand:+ start:81135 stop:81620 length:486 start_codon:yes stop_codon:yes gene_type:complete